MFDCSDDPEFPHWWDVLDETTPQRTVGGDVSGDAGGDLVKESKADSNGYFAGEESWASGTVERRDLGYGREVVENVWAYAEIVPGNDPDLWRKDEFGSWIRKLDYGRRESEFGWEIFDPGVGRHSQGVYAMRPMQWNRFLEQYEVFG